MTNQHPITPSPELVEQWMNQSRDTLSKNPFHWCCHVAAKSAQWGADHAEELRFARRPKPPSLKEQALEQLDGISKCFRVTHMGDIVCDKILAALEALPND